MKLQEFIDKVQALASSHADADIRFEWIELKNRIELCSSEAGFIDAKLMGGCVTISITEPMHVDDVRGMCDVQQLAPANTEMRF